MTFSYFDGVSGEPIYFQGIGRLKSPKLKDLYPTSGIGYSTYSLYVHFLDMNAEEMKAYAAHMGKSGMADGCMSVFEFAVKDEATRELLRNILALFFAGNVKWEQSFKCYVVYDEIDAEDEDGNPVAQVKPVGVISQDNFNKVKMIIMQLNYHKLDADIEEKFESEKAKELWERVQEYQKDTKVSEMDLRRMDIGNMISKLCASGIGYTLFNIGELTVFQLYDQFRQLSYMRNAHLSDRIFSIHGGKDYDVNDWLNPANDDYH